MRQEELNLKFQRERILKMKFEDKDDLREFLSISCGVVPMGGEKSGLVHELLIDNLSVGDVLRVWDYLENRGVRVEKFLPCLGNRYAIAVRHSNIEYLKNQIFDALIGEEDA